MPLSIPDYLGESADTEGRLGRPFQYGTWFVPGRAVVEGDDLLWWAGGWKKRPRADEYLLRDFVSIRNESAVLKFATKWGPLLLCEHELPRVHHASCQLVGGPKWWSRTRLVDVDKPCREKLSSWYRFAAMADSTLFAGAALRSDEEIPVERWRKIFAHPAFQPQLTGMPDLDCANMSSPWWNRRFDRRFVRDVLNVWLEVSAVRPLLASWDATPSLGFEVHGVFGAIAIQLLLATTATDGWVICSNPRCLETFSPIQRRPKTGQRRFCLKCREAGVPKALAKLDYNRRLREATNT
jgi:hypothetical protein